MGKLVKCHVCDNEIAASAKACPSCGAKKRKSLLFKLGVIFLPLIFIVSWLGSLDGGIARQPKPAIEEYQAAAPLDYRAGSLGEIEAGRLVKVAGQVRQVIGERRALLATGGNIFGTYTDNHVFLIFSSKPSILEGDKIEVYARYNGTQTYTAVLGDDRTVPSLVADYIEVTRKAK